MKKIKFLFVALLGLAAASCSNDATTGPTGTLSIKLTDAPMHYDQFMSASITIDKMEMGNSADPNSFVMISDKSMTYNMLELVNGLTSTIVNANIPTGNYNVMRLYISSTSMKLKNGETYTYNMNQNGYTGNGNGMMGAGMMLNETNKSIDITLPNVITMGEGEMHDYLIDLDVEHSFSPEGVNFTGTGMMMSMSGFSFMPVMRFVDMNTTGTIEGTVQGPDGNLANATITLMHNDTVYTTTHSDANGNYSFIGIPDGDYTMTIGLDGYMLSTTGNDVNMGTVTMMQHTAMNINFNMAHTI